MIMKSQEPPSLLLRFGVGSTFNFELLLPYVKEEPSDSNQTDDANAAEVQFFKGKKVLIAEDNPTNMKYAQTALSMFSKDIQIIEAWNGEEAYELYLKHKPDLILMDIVMPDVDGFQATGMIRLHDSKIPIVAMTAKALKADRQDCLEEGMDDYISKPVSLKHTLFQFWCYSTLALQSSSCSVKILLQTASATLSSEQLLKTSFPLSVNLTNSIETPTVIV